jgi:hypothetical protein
MLPGRRQHDSSGDTGYDRTEPEPPRDEFQEKHGTKRPDTRKFSYGSFRMRHNPKSVNTC